MSVSRRIAVILVGFTVLLLLGAAIAVHWVLHTESGANWVWSAARDSTAGQLQGQRLTGNFNDGVKLASLRWQSDGVDVQVTEVSLSVDADIRSRTIFVRDAHAKQVRVLTSDSGQESSSDDSLAQQIENLALPVVLEVETLTVDELQIQGAESAPITFNAISLDARWYRSLQIREAALTVNDTTIVARGNVELRDTIPVSLNVEAAHAMESVTVQVDGVMEQPTLSFSTQGITVLATGLAAIDLRDGLIVQASLAADYVNLHRFVDGWPQQHPMSGNVAFRVADNAIQVSDSTLRIDNSQAEASFVGAYNLDDDSVDANLRWANVRWPIAEDEPTMRSDAGDVAVGGTLQNWTARGALDVATNEVPDGRFVADVEGDLNEFAATIAEGNVFGGRLSGSLRFRWRDASPWSVDLTLQDVATDDLLADWPGTLSGHVVASGTLAPFSVSATLDDVVGDLRNAAFNANGAIAYSDAVASARDLQLTHGTLRASLDGSADQASGLAFDVSVGELGDYGSDLRGAVAASGTWSRVQDSSFLDLELRSDQLTVGDVLITDLSLTNERGAESVFAVQASAARIDLGDRQFLDAGVMLDYGKTQQRATLSADLVVREESADNVAGIGLTLGLEGAFADWQQPMDTDWQGELSQLSIDDGDYSLALLAPAALTVSRTRFSLQGFCAQDSAGAEICADASGAASGPVSVDAELQDLPVATLERFITTDVAFDQLVSGTLRWEQNDSGKPSAEADFEITPGTIRSRANPDLAVRSGSGAIRLQMVDGNPLSLHASLPMAQDGHLHTQLQVLDVAKGASSAVDGEFSLAMHNIGLFAEFIPVVDTLGGSLQMDFDIGGRIDAPDLTGAARLSQGRLAYAPIGMRLDDIELTAEIAADQGVRVDGRFVAGSGVGEITSRAEYAAASAPGVHFAIQGTDLLLVDVPDLQATVSPAVTVDYRDGQIAINGDVTIPRARIAPANLAENRVSESDDVVVVAGTLPDEPTADSQSELNWSGDLDLALGDNVVVDLDVARATVTGSSAFSWRGNPVPIANGRFDIAGNVEAYGQVLSITEGRIRFPNVVASNPVIRLRAERDIYGNSQVKQAGVLIDGTAKRPTIEAYTVPLTTEERALTLLVTGSDFDYEQGVGAVDFGTYIAPRLFVSYGIGIFDRDNVISARYDLSKGFGLKASSGSKQSGVDLNYRFEN